MWHPESAWEKTPLWLRWKGRERRRMSKAVWFFDIVVVSHKRIWEYR